MSKWLHPLHARGVRTGRTDFSGNGVLTDAKIAEYIRLGWYGEERRRALAEFEAQAKKVPRRRPSRPLALALALLENSL